MSAAHLPGVFATLTPLLDHYGYLVVGGALFLQNLGWPVSLGQSMFIAGAGTLRYKRIVEVIDAAKGAGVDRVGIVTDRMRREAAAHRQ